jgi:hypothetical protein
MVEFSSLDFLKLRAEDARLKAAVSGDRIEKDAFLTLAESFDQLREAIENLKT